MESYFDDSLVPEFYRDPNYSVYSNENRRTVLFIVSYLIWQPFFKVYEKQQYEEENGGAKAQ